MIPTGPPVQDLRESKEGRLLQRYSGSNNFLSFNKRRTFIDQLLTVKTTKGSHEIFTIR